GAAIRAGGPAAGTDRGADRGAGAAAVDDGLWRGCSDPDPGGAVDPAIRAEGMRGNGMDDPGLELKDAGGLPLQAETGAAGCVIEGYASLFGIADQGGDVIAAGAYAGSLARIAARGDRVRMLWQHDPAHPIGVWEEIREDSRGLWVRGRLLPEVARAREAAALVAAGAIDGLSIGYRTLRARSEE